MEKIFEKKGFLILVFILIVLIIIIVNSGNSQNEVTTINSKNELSELLKQDDTVIIDVRTLDEYNQSHIPQAINIPYNELENKIKYEKNLNIIVYSDNDSRSHFAAIILQDMGYKNIYEANISDYQGNLTK